MTPDERRRLEADIAAWVTELPGVAYLSPRLPHRLTTRPGTTGGVRLRRTAPPTVEVWIAVRPGHQASATASSVRERIALKSGCHPGLAGIRAEIVVTACLNSAPPPT
ncbi:hypothetical protein ACIA8O_36140 [Kitasatospora sp. NPDC051853]|uniref:hypothetical protein n=1 Tax=Kitasatospora sp. NPDC051853 TaxID=3364058 RepID=UPI0037B2B7A1